jgi:hypothetical protein
MFENLNDDELLNYADKHPESRTAVATEQAARRCITQAKDEWPTKRPLTWVLICLAALAVLVPIVLWLTTPVTKNEWIMWRGAALEQWAPAQGYATESACKKEATESNAAAVDHGGYAEFTCFPQSFTPPQKR